MAATNFALEGGPAIEEANHYFFIVSDGSGETAVNLLRALLTQFTDSVGGIYTRRYPKTKNKEMVDKVISQAARVDGKVFIAYTLVNTQLRAYIKNQMAERGFPGLDLFSTPLARVSMFLGVQPQLAPDKFHGVNEQYFKRMEAIEFTLNHDDGKRVEGLEAADIVLVGVSRTGKTPLSIYLSLYGFKVVNVPLAMEVTPPAELEHIDQRKIVALTIDPARLAEIRKKRLSGFSVSNSDYSNPEKIMEEVEYVRAFFRKHRRWPVIDVTNRSIEETAGIVRDKVFGRDRPV